MNYTNELNLPQPLVDAVRSNHSYKEHRYSVTEVLGGTCEAILKRRHDREITEDVSQRIWALFGTAVHEVLRKAKGTETQLQENWISVKIDETDYELSGIFDLYDDSTGTVTDYKTAGTIKWLKHEFDDYRQQVLAYCWMLRKLGFNAKNGEIVMLLRDWSKSKARFDKDYPKHQVQKVSWSFEEADFAEIERHITAWFEAVAHQEGLADDELEPCSQEQRWHKDDKWAVTKNGVKRATRVLDSEESAETLMAELEAKTGKGHHVEFRQGEDVKCEMYCSVSEFCPFCKKEV
jgi:hypothetical protein